MKERFCFMLDLVDDEAKIMEYEVHHRAVWPEVEDSFRRAGIDRIELYRGGNRLFMMLDTNETFSFHLKEQIDAEDAVVQKWETLMSGYQKPIPGLGTGGKWVLMKRIYTFIK